ncbi:MAG: hypothetical protein ACJAS1_000726 [Oleiphilaceae bacterium]|jgi:hypothetical protein
MTLSKPTNKLSSQKNSELKANPQSLLLVEHFKSLYRTMCAEDLQEELLEEVYDEDLLFQDSFHKIQSRAAFLRYCSELYQNLKSCDFDFHDQWISDGQAMLTWTMAYSHPKLNRGKHISVSGSSHIRFNEKVYFHQDYFDGGALLYEHVPVLGSIIQQLKKRMA